MPLREFHCVSCGSRFEELVRSGAEDGVVCPHCSSADLERLVSVFGFQASRTSPSRSSASGSCSSCSCGNCATCR